MARKYQSVFRSPEGQEVLKDLLNFTKVAEPTFTVGQADVTAYKEGLRRVGLRLLSMTEAEISDSASKNVLTEEVEYCIIIELN